MLRKWLSVLAYGLEIFTFILFKGAFIHADPISTAVTHFHVKDWLEMVGVLSLTAAIIYLSMWGHKYVEKYPKLVVFAAVVSVLIGIGSQISKMDKADAAANLWLFFAGLIGCWVYRKYKADQLNLSYMSLLVPIALVGMNFYASFVFPAHLSKMGWRTPVRS
jgi:amino acid permease